MNSLIEITSKNGISVVSARHLHVFLEVKTDFTDWCKRMFEYGFEENIDYTIVLKNGENKVSKSNPIDYALTLDTSKEISMLQRTDKGKIARQYFIECEKKLHNSSMHLSRKDLALMVIAQEEANEKLQAENNRLKPRSEFVDKIFATDGLISMSQVAKVLKLDYGRNSLYKLLREKGILFKTSNEPKQELVTRGYFELKEKSITRAGHPDKVVMTTYVTQKGLAFIAKDLGVITVPNQLIPIIP